MWEVTMDLALLILRVGFGLGMAAHGAQKAFGWWGGPGPNGVTGMMRQFGYRPAGFWAAVLILAELVGGTFLAIGFITPVAAMFLISNMAHAAYRVHRPKGFFAGKGGFELPGAYAVVALAVLVAGPGGYSVDALAGLAYSQPLTTIIALVLALIGATLPYATRAAEPEAVHSPT